MDDPLVDTQRPAAEVTHPHGKLVEQLEPASHVLASELDAMPLTERLVRRELALVDRALKQQPGRNLHEARGEAHALGRVGERRRSTERARLRSTRTVEIGRRLLDERHAVLKENLEGV
jgi:hypothetical protein